MRFQGIYRWIFMGFPRVWRADLTFCPKSNPPLQEGRLDFSMLEGWKSQTVQGPWGGLQVQGGESPVSYDYSYAGTALVYSSSTESVWVVFCWLVGLGWWVWVGETNLSFLGQW